MGDGPDAAGEPGEAHKGTFKSNLVQVSNVKKPLFFYVNLAERLLEQFDTIEFSALGLAISTVVTVVEILKQNQVATVTGKKGRKHTTLSFSLPPPLSLSARARARVCAAAFAIATLLPSFLLLAVDGN